MRTTTSIDNDLVPPKKKVLCLGVSYASLADQLAFNESSPDLLHHPIDSVEAALESVERGVLNEMDGRDLTRCRATEEACNVQVYTVSQERGALYRSDRHVSANFNRSHAFVKALKQLDVSFDQIVLDYFWIPAGWDVEHWSRSFFRKTLPALVQHDILLPSGKIYLPFCFHCFREVLASFSVLREHYNVQFLRQQDLAEIWLWKGTNTLDPVRMQRVLAKRIDQEQVYCTFGPGQVREAMEDADVSKETIASLARKLEDFGEIRFIVLEPLAVETEQAAAALDATTRSSTKPKARRKLLGDFLGCLDPSQVQRGFDGSKRAGGTIVAPMAEEKKEAETIVDTSKEESRPLSKVPASKPSRVSSPVRATKRKARQSKIVTPSSASSRRSTKRSSENKRTAPTRSAKRRKATVETENLSAGSPVKRKKDLESFATPKEKPKRSSLPKTPTSTPSPTRGTKRTPGQSKIVTPSTSKKSTKRSLEKKEAQSTRSAKCRQTTACTEELNRRSPVKKETPRRSRRQSPTSVVPYNAQVVQNDAARKALFKPC